MALTYSTASKSGDLAPSFKLPGVDGKTYSLDDFKSAKGLIVVFMCNHCPYVVAVQGRINALAREFAAKGVQLIGINSNDSKKYPDDGFEAMKVRAREEGYVFPYLFDETQSVARAYDAACTPDPYVYENVEGKFLLRYRGRIDDSWKDESAVKHRELAEAVQAMLSSQPISTDQKPSLGCNIKWR